MNIHFNLSPLESFLYRHTKESIGYVSDYVFKTCRYMYPARQQVVKYEILLQDAYRAAGYNSMDIICLNAHLVHQSFTICNYDSVHRSVNCVLLIYFEAKKCCIFSFQDSEMVILVSTL